ncbi:MULTISPECIES: hypothetical protein [unclassified Leptolyngbya]|uniref:hypothetical protein n=1 Tax=unclassified Leptolyngbya TaxID=2650499 RepID=UPI001687AF56|nr:MULTISPECIES: hypothetical protein [unclassified Leptolyngbya]MBD1913967.1 hypothetical protein [Leptolyngbya sp. FACHB-8]MBD2155934.1 hypothetical protein [Leptolyngbya sp. FACHB-16]
MNDLAFWKSVFLAKSVITAAEGAALFIGDAWLRYILHAPPLVNTEYSQLFYGVVFFIGIAYSWVSSDVVRNLGIIKFGVCVQTFVFVVLAYHTFAGNIHPLYFTPGIIDLIFAILYSVFLVQYSQNSPEPVLGSDLA